MNKITGYQIKAIEVYADAEKDPDYFPQESTEAKTIEEFEKLIADGHITDSAIEWGMYAYDGDVHHHIKDYASFNDAISTMRLLSGYQLEVVKDWDVRITTGVEGQSTDDCIIIWDVIRDMYQASAPVAKDCEWPHFMPDHGWGSMRAWVETNQPAITRAIVEWAGERYENDPFDMELAPEFLGLWQQDDASVMALLAAQGLE